MFIQLLALWIRFRVKRLKFGEWADREDLAASIGELTDANQKLFPELAIRYTSISLNLSQTILRKLSWDMALALFVSCHKLHSPRKIPLTSAAGGSEKSKKMGWDYPGRGSHYWYHLLAASYGWTLEYIKNLDPDTALAMIQEVLVSDQLEKEFYWSLSEIAYPYNSTTKQSKFQPLTRPYFMAQAAPEIKMVRIKKSMLPVGVGIDKSGMVEHYENKAKSAELN